MEHATVKVTPVTMAQIADEYINGDLCMAEHLASYPADGLTLEEAFGLYVKAKLWADGDITISK